MRATQLSSYVLIKLIKTVKIVLTVEYGLRSQCCGMRML